MLASQQQERALDDQRRHMDEVQQQALEEQWKKLERQFEGRLGEVRAYSVSSQTGRATK